MIIDIEELRFECIIGLLEHERHTPQEIIIDLTLHYDYTEEFINYAEVVTLIESHMKEAKYELLETALNNLFDLLSKNFPLIEQLYIKITKPDILPNCRVCVSNVKNY